MKNALLDTLRGLRVIGLVALGGAAVTTALMGFVLLGQAIRADTSGTLLIISGVVTLVAFAALIGAHLRYQDANPDEGYGY